MLLRFLFSLIAALSMTSFQVYAQDAQGLVEPKMTYDLRFGVPGVVRSVGVEAGNVVLPGTLLVELDPAYYEAHKMAMSKDNDLAEAQFEEAKRAFERDQVLFDEGSMSVVELELSRLNLLKAEAGFEKSNAALVAAGSRLKQSRLYAPVAGKVVRINAFTSQSILADGDGVPSVVFSSSQRVVRFVVDRTQQVPAMGDSVTIGQEESSDLEGTVTHIDFTHSTQLIITIEAKGDLPAVGTAVSVSY